MLIGHREANADIAAAGARIAGVDADQIAAQIDERAAGIAGIDRGLVWMKSS